jgi:hypothetical protein
MLICRTDIVYRDVSRSARDGGGGGGREKGSPEFDLMKHTADKTNETAVTPHLSLFSSHPQHYTPFHHSSYALHS